MANITGATFDGGVTNVDGNYYKNCAFKNTQITFNGGPLPSFVDCSFDGCSLSLAGPAANTMAYINAIYHGFGEWGKTSVDLMFKSIQESAPPTGVQSGETHGN